MISYQRIIKGKLTDLDHFAAGVKQHGQRRGIPQHFVAPDHFLLAIILITDAFMRHYEN